MDIKSILYSLDHHELIDLLSTLCSVNEQTKDSVIDLVTKRLQDINVEGIVEQVFNSLNNIDVHELWDRSGQTYYGYNDPSEEAGVMIKEAIESFTQRLNDYRRFDMKKEEEIYCQAICGGLLKYESGGTNEFHSWSTDDPQVIADNLYYNWKEKNLKDNWTAVYVKEAHHL